MTETSTREVPFVTVAMAEILLAQDMIAEARGILARLKTLNRDDPRVAELERRFEDRAAQGDALVVPGTEEGRDRVLLDGSDGGLRIVFELTQDGLGIARRRVRYSGQTIIRLFTATPGPRGVRTSHRDMEIEHRCAAMSLRGLPRRAAHVAAVGFLGRNGAFVPLATSRPWLEGR